MKSLKLFAYIIFASCVAFSCAKKQADLCGTWRMVAGSYVGPDFSVKTDGQNRMCYKIISENHFAVVEVYADNPDSMFFAAVGAWHLKDSIYTEIYEASNVPTKIGEKMEFHSVISANTWQISSSKDDLSLEETWVHIKALPGAVHEM